MSLPSTHLLTGISIKLTEKQRWFPGKTLSTAETLDFLGEIFFSPLSEERKVVLMSSLAQKEISETCT